MDQELMNFHKIRDLLMCWDILGEENRVANNLKEANKYIFLL